MEKIIINGGHNRLVGTVKIEGAKNAVLPLLAATVLASEGVTILKNVPVLSDVFTMNNVVRGLNAKVTFNEEENTIVIDKNNLKSIEIPNFIPSGSNVKFVTINGKKLPVKYMNIRTASNEEITPAVYVYGDKLVIPVEVLKYVGIDVDKYDIEATLEDGTTVSKSIQLEVINSSNKEDDKVTEKPSDNNQITNKPSNKPSNNEIANGNANKNDSIKLENSSNNKLPNTGAAVSSGLIGSLSTLIGAVLLRKKK